MDTRGQGGEWRSGDTSDIEDDRHRAAGPGRDDARHPRPATYYYRRLMTDAVLAVDAARDLPIVDGVADRRRRASQGGGLALVAAALARRR